MDFTSADPAWGQSFFKNCVRWYPLACPLDSVQISQISNQLSMQRDWFTVSVPGDCLTCIPRNQDNGPLPSILNCPEKRPPVLTTPSWPLHPRLNLPKQPHKSLHHLTPSSWTEVVCCFYWVLIKYESDQRLLLYVLPQPIETIEMSQHII